MIVRSAVAVALVAILGVLSVDALQADPGARVLGYLHARGEALDISSPQPIKAVYLTALDPAYSSPQAMVMAAVDAGFNVLIATGLQPSATGSDAVVGFCAAWAAVQVSSGQAPSSAAIAYIHARGAVLLASAGGAGEYPYGSDATAYGNAAAAWVAAHAVDGVDFFLSHIDNGFQFFGQSSAGLVRWVVTATLAARRAFGFVPCGPLLTHSPLPLYFGRLNDASSWAGYTGGYTGVVQAFAASDPPGIDWYHIQYYGIGAAGGQCFATFRSVFLSSAADCQGNPDLAVAEIAAVAFVPVGTLVVVKPLGAQLGYASGGAMSNWTVEAAAAVGWSAGFGFWAWAGAAEAAGLLDAVYPASRAPPSIAPMAACTSASPSDSSSQSASVSFTQTPVTRSASPTQTASLDRSATRTRSPSQGANGGGAGAAPGAGGADAPAVPLAVILGVAVGGGVAILLLISAAVGCGACRGCCGGGGAAAGESPPPEPSRGGDGAPEPEDGDPRPQPGWSAPRPQRSFAAAATPRPPRQSSASSRGSDRSLPRGGSLRGVPAPPALPRPSYDASQQQLALHIPDSVLSARGGGPTSRSAPTDRREGINSGRDGFALTARRGSATVRSMPTVRRDSSGRMTVRSLGVPTLEGAAEGGALARSARLPPLASGRSTHRARTSSDVLPPPPPPLPPPLPRLHTPRASAPQLPFPLPLAVQPPRLPSIGAPPPAAPHLFTPGRRSLPLIIPAAGPLQAVRYTPAAQGRRAAATPRRTASATAAEHLG